MKKEVSLNGNLVSTLKEGNKAVIASGGSMIITSPVVEIIEKSSEYIRFETMNSIYRIILTPNPIEAALQKPFAMCA